MGYWIVFFFTVIFSVYSWIRGLLEWGWNVLISCLVVVLVLKIWNLTSLSNDQSGVRVNVDLSLTNLIYFQQQYQYQINEINHLASYHWLYCIIQIFYSLRYKLIFPQSNRTFIKFLQQYLIEELYFVS